MGARTDLLIAGEALAAGARRRLEGEGNPSPLALDDVAARMPAALAAFEAAQLAEDMKPGEIEQALDGIRDVLEEAGVLDEADRADLTQFLRRTFQAIVAWRNEVLIAQGYQVAYERVVDTMAALELDFIAGNSEVSRRIAARIRTSLDDGEHVIKRGQEAAGASTETE